LKAQLQREQEASCKVQRELAKVKAHNGQCVQVVLWLYSVDMSTALLIYIPFASSLLYLYRISFQLKKEEEENAR